MDHATSLQTKHFGSYLLLALAFAFSLTAALALAALALVRGAFFGAGSLPLGTTGLPNWDHDGCCMLGSCGIVFNFLPQKK